MAPVVVLRERWSVALLEWLPWQVLLCRMICWVRPCTACSVSLVLLTTQVPVAKHQPWSQSEIANHPELSLYLVKFILSLFTHDCSVFRLSISPGFSPMRSLRSAKFASRLSTSKAHTTVKVSCRVHSVILEDVLLL